MRFLAVFIVLICAVTLSQGYPKFGRIPEGPIFNARVIDGIPAEENQFPHQAYLIVFLWAGGIHACGGSLIGSRWVITSARCVNGAYTVIVYMGGTELGEIPVELTTHDTYVHPFFDSGTLSNDIGLVELPEDAPLGDNVRPIALDRDPFSYEGQIATASGYGYTDNGGPVSPNLNFIDGMIISNDECAASFGTFITPSSICIVGIESPSQGMCNGDIGGPLVLGSGDDMTLIGVSSFVSGTGCSSDYPSSFTRTSHFVDWINEITGL